MTANNVEMFCPSILLSVVWRGSAIITAHRLQHHSNGNTWKSQLSKLSKFWLLFCKKRSRRAVDFAHCGGARREGKTQHERLIPLPVTHAAIWSCFIPLAAYVHSYAREGGSARGRWRDAVRSRAAQFPGTSSLAADCSSWINKWINNHTTCCFLNPITDEVNSASWIIRPAH